MVLPRSSALRASSLARYARSARSIRSAELQPWQQMLQRRTYASSHGGHAAAKQSEVPWMIASGLATGTALYFVLTQDTSHGEGHGHESEDLVVKEEMLAKEAELKEAPMAEADLKKQHEADMPGVKPAEEDNTDVDPKKTSDVESGSESKEASKDEPSDNKESHGEKPSSTDKPDARKENQSDNEMSGKQAGLSNDDTHHSTSIEKDDTKSKKGEGVAETAKVKGTVSPERPAAENKEERGKAEQDKNA